MGAFCVFGVSRQMCKAKAERAIPASYVADKVRHYLTPTEWGGKVAVEAARLFDATDKTVRVSPEFDAPQFCRDWFAVDPGQVKLACIMVRGPKVGDDGKPVLRKGAPVMTWLPYKVGGVVQHLAAPPARAQAVAA